MGRIVNRKRQADELWKLCGHNTGRACEVLRAYRMTPDDATGDSTELALWLRANINGNRDVSELLTELTTY